LRLRAAISSASTIAALDTDEVAIDAALPDWLAMALAREVWEQGGRAASNQNIRHPQSPTVQPGTGSARTLYRDGKQKMRRVVNEGAILWFNLPDLREPSAAPAECRG
jgi:hypothetical protein